MMWLTLGAKLLGIGQALGRAARGMVRWTLSDIRHAAIVTLFAALAVMWLQNGKWERRAEKALAAVEYRDLKIAGFKQFIREMAYQGEKASQLQIAMNKRQADTYSANKEKADARYQNALADNARFERMVAANRLRPARSGSEAIAGNRAAQGEATGLPKAMPVNTVMVDEAELRRTNDLAIIGLNALEWAQSLIRDGVAE